MSFWTRYTPCGSLEEWLRIATRGLCRAAQERIALEITTHFDEAVAGHLAEGCSEVGAKLMSLEELGDAGVAAHKFRRKHLTAMDAKSIRQILESASSQPTILRYSVIVLIGCSIILGLLAGMKSSSFKPWLCAVTFCLNTAVYYLTRGRRPNSQLKRTLIIYFLGMVSVVSVGVGIFPHRWTIIFALAISVLFLSYMFRIWQKAKNDRFDWSS